MFLGTAGRPLLGGLRQVGHAQEATWSAPEIDPHRVSGGLRNLEGWSGSSAKPTCAIVSSRFSSRVGSLGKSKQFIADCFDPHALGPGVLEVILASEEIRKSDSRSIPWVAQ